MSHSAGQNSSSKIYFMASAKKAADQKKAAPEKKAAPKKTSKAKGLKLGGVPTKGGK
jgi:hypothetical protein